MFALDTDPTQLVARIVYAGPQGAGKATNLLKLYEALPTHKRGEVSRHESPAETRQQLVIEANNIGPYELRYELTAFSFGDVLLPQHQDWLAQADVVVFVCESDAAQLKAARARLQNLREFLAAQRQPPLPLIVQANKQDFTLALSQSEIVRTLELENNLPLVLSSALQGEGVNETFVKATRFIGELAQGFLQQQPRSPAPVKAARPSRPLNGQPPLPDPKATTNLVLPGWQASEILRQVPWAEVQLRSDLMGKSGQSDGSGKTDTFIYRAGNWCLKTSAQRRFQNEEAVIKELAQLMIVKGALDNLHPANTLYCAEPDADNLYWLWTISPWLLTLRGEMSAAVAAQDEDALTLALAKYASAVVRALRLAVQMGFVLDVHPSNFANQSNRIVYIDDEVSPGTSIPTAGYALLLRVQEYAQWPRAISGYLEAFGEALQTKLRPEELERVDLLRLVREVTPASELVAGAKEQLLEQITARLGA